MTSPAQSREVPTHLPVLVGEVLTYLAPRPGAVIVDATIGEGGHAEALLRRIAPAGRLIGLDRDPEAVTRSEERLRAFGQNVVVRQASFEQMDEVLDEIGVGLVDGVLFDLGVSTRQLFAAERGFSFDRLGPLDMRMDPLQPRTAADLLNTLNERALADLIHRYGEERGARRIARQIVGRRPLRTTRDLVRAVEAAIGGARGRLHPATRTFQALRIATNDELETLTVALPQAIERLRPDGRLCAIAFHSLEDRIVKRLFTEAATSSTPPGLPVELPGHGPQFISLTRGAERAGDDEVRQNPRSTAVRLRALQRVQPGACTKVGQWAWRATSSP